MTHNPNEYCRLHLVNIAAQKQKQKQKNSGIHTLVKIKLVLFCGART